MNKYTAVYEDRWMSGSHMNVLTKICRFSVRNNESVLDALKRLNIEDSTVFIFHGHPLLQGETNEEFNQNFRTT